MRSKRSLSSSRRPITTRRIKNIVNKALNDVQEWGPSKGYKYLKDISLGSKFETGSVEGILLDVNKSAARVLITNVLFGDKGLKDKARLFRGAMESWAQKKYGQGSKIIRQSVF